MKAVPNLERGFKKLKKKIYYLLHNPKKLKKDDSLLLYYSGHGYIDEKINEVYWLPYDSGINEYLKNLWFSNNELIKSLNLTQNSSHSFCLFLYSIIIFSSQFGF